MLEHRHSQSLSRHGCKIPGGSADTTGTHDNTLLGLHEYCQTRQFQLHWTKKTITFSEEWHASGGVMDAVPYATQWTAMGLVQMVIQLPCIEK